MISVLIPVYNYDVTELVSILHRQLEGCDQDYEIICFDDKSDPEFSTKNQTINALDNTRYECSASNVGRTQARQNLAQLASYDWLLFLDADVLPKNDSFISDYLIKSDTDYDAIYGGFAYHKKSPGPEYALRWNYGRTHEQVAAETRNRKPYKVIISANFMIRKLLFLDLNSRIEQKGYGYDNYFGGLLKEKASNVLHIDNEVYHLGIETNAIYLRKKEQAAETLLKLTRATKLNDHQNDLLRLFTRMKTIRLNYLASFFFKTFRFVLQKNLLSNNPSMMYFQFYRIGYMCFKDLEKV